MSEQYNITQVIQLILAPAVMINATGLLLLTVSNKYSVIYSGMDSLRTYTVVKFEIEAD